MMSDPHLLGVFPRYTSPSNAAGRGCPGTQLQPRALPSPEVPPSPVPSHRHLALQDRLLSPLPELLDDAEGQLVLSDASHLVRGLPHQLNDGDVTQLQPAGSLLWRRGRVVRGRWGAWEGVWWEGLLTCSMEICIL